MVSLLLDGMNVKNEISNSKVVIILIYQNAIGMGRKKYDFIFFFEHYKIQQNKDQINFKTKRAAGVLGKITPT